MAVLNEHKKNAYRVQKWLMTSPANIVDSEQSMSMDERKHNIHVSTSEERIEWQTEWRRDNHQRWGRQDADSREMQIQEVAKGREKVEIKRK